MSKTTETKRISLNSINSDDKRYQIRESEGATKGEKVSQESASRNHIKAIVKALNDNPNTRIPPIEVVVDPCNAERYIIVDGFHRYSAFCKIFKASKGKRYKQLRVEVHTHGVSTERYLSINSEHKALALTAQQRTEQQWQAFLLIKHTEPKLSIEKTAERLGMATSTISKWRHSYKQFLNEGFFDVKSKFVKSPLGYPTLAACRKALKQENALKENQPQETLTEKDKGLLEAILKQAVKADNPDELREFVLEFWREDPRSVPYDLPIKDLIHNEEYSKF